MKRLSDSSNAFLDFEHDHVEVLQAEYENNWKIFSYLKATTEVGCSELLQAIIVTPLQHIPLQGTDEGWWVPIFCREPCGHLGGEGGGAGQKTCPRQHTTPWLSSALSEASLDKPWRKPRPPTVWRPGERWVNEPHFRGISSCHLGKWSICARTGYSLLRKEQTLKTGKLADYWTLITRIHQVLPGLYFLWRMFTKGCWCEDRAVVTNINQLQLKLAWNKPRKISAAGQTQFWKPRSHTSRGAAAQGDMGSPSPSPSLL